jgi:hypothetical protein
LIQEKRMSRKVPSALVALGLALVCATSAQAAKKMTAKAVTTTRVITACVKTKTGAVKILSSAQAKKKCPKGSEKLSWNVTGPAGKNGTNGTGTAGATGSAGANGANGTNGANGGALQVYDAKGRLGAFAGTITNGLPAYNVLAPDGGIYAYTGAGQVVPSGFGGGPGGSSFVFADAFCQGTAYVPVGSAAIANLYAANFIGPLRFVFRTIDASTSAFGPMRVWKFTTAQSTVPASPAYSSLNPTTGGCQALAPADQPAAGSVLLALEAVTPPRDGAGPLTIG